MSSVAELLERESRNIDLEPGDFERLTHRRDRRQRNRRILSAVVALVVAGVAIGGLLQVISSGSVPADEPSSPFEGTWISTSDADGGTQTMTVQVFAEGAVEIVVTDTIATVCGGTPSTMTGTGRIEDGTALVIPAPNYTCDDGSEPETLSGPPLDEQLRDWTLFLDPENDWLTDGLGGVWVREGAEVPSPKPTTSGGMWPQTSLEEVRQAQELADAGDPDYTWQIDPELASETLYPWESEIVDRFLREELGWEAWSIGKSGVFAGHYDEVVLIRCAPGQTNPLYPDEEAFAEAFVAEVRGCAPTIDDFRFETVMLSLGQPAGRGPSGIWVVTRWEMLQPVEPRSFFEHLYPHLESRQVVQVAPPSDAEVAALLQAFLGSRVDGEGAEQYMHRHPDGLDENDLAGPQQQEVPVLYATTGGSAYERSEFEPVRGPVWPTGWIEVRIRLFARDGTVVEQSFVVVRQEDGRLGLMYGLPMGSDYFPTTENGEPVPLPYSLLDGEVAFAAAPPWGLTSEDRTSTLLGGVGRGSASQFTMFMVTADPRPGMGCEPGPPVADVDALVRSIRSNPDLEATAPVAASVGGIDALRMDVVAPRPLEVGDCAPMVIDPLSAGEGPVRLYLLDLPEGMSARTLAIGISAVDSEFELVVEAAAPVLDSFEFHTR